MREFVSFYKTVSGNEGDKCYYPTRLDTYGCGCFHDCKYCYAKSLLDFRGLWEPSNPSVADIKKIERKIKSLKRGSVVRLGGMTDCFQPCEENYEVTYRTIQLLNRYGIHYLIVTKSNLIATDKYIKILDRNLAHIQITITSTDDAIAHTYERATSSSLRIKAIEILTQEGFDVAVRVSPYIPEYIDFNILNNINCKKAVVEFLRVNTFIKRIFNIDYTNYTHKENGYYHLNLDRKINLIKNFTGFDQITVCEDCNDAYEYWKHNINYNPNDCCNLSFEQDEKNYIGNYELLKLKKTAFLSSRQYEAEDLKKVKEWANGIIQNNVCVISGFQSRLEREALNVLLEKQNVKIIMVLSRKIFKECPAKYKKAVNDGRLLIISPFKTNSLKPTLQTSTKRNKYIIDNSDEIMVGTISEGGMLDQLTRTRNVTVI